MVAATVAIAVATATADDVQVVVAHHGRQYLQLLHPDVQHAP